MTAVLDTGAVVAWFYRERGWERVAELLDGAVLSTVNLAELATVLTRHDHPDAANAAEGVAGMGVRVVPFLYVDAAKAGELWHATRKFGLSLGDRACLAVAARAKDGVAITTDRAWRDLEVDVPIEVIR